ncbi:MAG: protein kinase [Planctomycetes bacterium]|nr:protein kinase [Planctomycetota bacterium]
MVTTELGACEWFVWDLRRSNLLDRNQLDQLVGEFIQKNPRAEPPALAEYLVAQGILTPFQSERLLQGKTQGFVLGPFTLMEALGAGSMGTVYKAQSKNDSQWYAVKVLPRRSMWNVRIARRKVRSFEQARHPSVVPFVDVGTAGGMHYLAWPYVEGELLDKVVTQRGKISPELAAYYAVQIAEGLEVCHQQGLIHGLLKPSNLMVDAEQQVKILDFGIGCLLAETEGESLVDTMSTSNAIASGLDCASPESIMDPTNLTPAGDQYSLGCMLYFMVTGQYPFPEGAVAEKMMAHQFKQPTPIAQLNSSVPADLVAIIERLMQKAPENRYGTFAEVVEALKPLASGPAAGPRLAKPGAILGKPLGTAPQGLRGLKSGGSSPGFKPGGSNPDANPASLSSPGTKPAGSLSSPSTKPAGSLSNSGTAPVSPSAPTPKPQSLGKLPTRGSLLGLTPVPTTKESGAQPESESRHENAEWEVPGGNFATEEKSWEERLGPFGIVLSTVAACALVYLLAVWFKIF